MLAIKICGWLYWNALYSRNAKPAVKSKQVKGIKAMILKAFK